MVDALAIVGVLLHSVWLLPLLAVLIAVDGPLPVLPTETLLVSAWAVAIGNQDVPVLLGLFVVAVIGSAAGDLLVYSLGRGSNRLSDRAARAECGASRWVRTHLRRRPGATLVGARFLPAGRLVSTAAAGRFGMRVSRFLPWSLASSAAWSTYMLGIGVLLGPITGGAPLLSLLAGAVIAVVTAAGFALARRIQARRAAIA